MKIRAKISTDWNLYKIWVLLGVRRSLETGFVALGSPVGCNNFSVTNVLEKINSVRNITELLPLLSDPHSEFALLRSCFSLPKLTYLLRTVDPQIHLHLWKNFDDLMRDTFTRIIRTPLTDLQWAQCQLPISMGGLGLCSAANHAPAAFISSVLAADSLKDGLVGGRSVKYDINSSVELLNQHTGENDSP